jgi:hypothetical protein
VYIKLEDKIISKWMIECVELCNECSSRFGFVLMTIDKCPFGENKPVCSN